MKNTEFINTEQFNQFLKGIGGLKLPYREDEEKKILDRNFFEICDGWLSIVRDLITDLIEMGWDKRVFQVKEKFGGLEFYVGMIPDGGLDRINEARRLSHTTCEVCGVPGELRTDRYWFKTLCDKCND